MKNSKLPPGQSPYDFFPINLCGIDFTAINFHGSREDIKAFMRELVQNSRVKEDDLCVFYMTRAALIFFVFGRGAELLHESTRGLNCIYYQDDVLEYACPRKYAGEILSAVLSDDEIAQRVIRA